MPPGTKQIIRNVILSIIFLGIAVLSWDFVDAQRNKNASPEEKFNLCLDRCVSFSPKTADCPKRCVSILEQK